eukprot:1331897-Amorphochlora_amoeboformis.AAC.2
MKYAWMIHLSCFGYGVVRVRSLGPFNPAPKEADKNFVPIDQALNSEEDGPVGPLACLLVGFSEGDCVKFRRMM